MDIIEGLFVLLSTTTVKGGNCPQLFRRLDLVFNCIIYIMASHPLARIKFLHCNCLRSLFKLLSWPVGPRAHWCHFYSLAFTSFFVTCRASYYRQLPGVADPGRLKGVVTKCCYGHLTPFFHDCRHNYWVPLADEENFCRSTKGVSPTLAAFLHGRKHVIIGMPVPTASRWTCRTTRSTINAEGSLCIGAWQIQN